MNINKEIFEELHHFYQTRIDWITKIEIMQGIYHAEIFSDHILTKGTLTLPGEKPSIAIVPYRLSILVNHQLSSKGALPLDNDENINFSRHDNILIYHPTLEGILLSECLRLKQRSLVNKLISLFQQFNNPELRLKLVWLCWYDLMSGNDISDWTESLKWKSAGALHTWIQNREESNPGLSILMNRYVGYALQMDSGF